MAGQPRGSEDSLDIGALVVRACDGDGEALVAIVDRCTPMVRSVARRYLRSRADVEDVVQEVWLCFTEHMHRIQSPESTRAWLVRATTRAAWRVQRRRLDVVLTSQLEERASIDDTEAAGLRRADREATRRAVQAALDGLSRPDRRLIELLMADERPNYRALAALVDRPIGSIGPTRQRILARLRREGSLALATGRSQLP